MIYKNGAVVPDHRAQNTKYEEDYAVFFLVNNPNSHSTSPVSQNPFEANPAPNPHSNACHQSNPSNMPKWKPQANIPSPMPITQEIIL